MTPKELFEAIGLVEDALVMEADVPVTATPRPWLAVVRRAVPLAACLCLVAGAALALRGGVLHGALAGGSSGAAAQDAAPPAAAAAPEPAAAPAEGGADAGSTAEYGAGTGSAKIYEAADGAAIADAPAGAAQDGADNAPASCAGVPLQGSQVFYWGSQLEPELQAALWGEGEPEPWQDVPAALPAEAAPDAEPAALPVLRGGQSLGDYALCSRADAQALLLDGAFLSEEAVPRGATDPKENELPAELVYNPTGSALRVPMWAFTVLTDMACGDVVCYVPAIDLGLLRQLLADA